MEANVNSKMSGFLPMSVEELNRLGISQPDFILVTGDAYVDHPSFGAAIIGRVLQSRGYSVAIISQPAWDSSVWQAETRFSRYRRQHRFHGESLHLGKKAQE